MRVVIQRVSKASVSVSGEVVAAIAAGMLVLLGVEETDTREDIEWLAQKLAKLRLFSDESGPWNRCLADGGHEALVVSQFTLFASTRKGTKPSWHRAAKPELAEPMCVMFAEVLNGILPTAVKSGQFGAMMEVALVNDGPVTLIVDSKVRE